MTEVRDRRRAADILQEAARALEQAGIESALSDAELLLGFCLNKSRTALYLAGGEPLEPAAVKCYTTLIDRRLRREPVAYIIGEREFWSRSFLVTPAVLIPRPETEFLVESALTGRNKALPLGPCLDLCCGSGVIATVLALELRCAVVALDISFEALQIARENSLRHKVAERIVLVQADLESCFAADACFPLIVTNPPYVRKSEIEHQLEPEVAGYEPHLALDGGSSGLDLIKRISRVLPRLLIPGGDCFMEIGSDQGKEVQALFGNGSDAQFYEPPSILQDYSGRDRVLHIRRKTN